ncbi:MAG: hypothetical protein WAW37_02360 [Syntrophobacteraceae bacterium]
MLGSVQATGKVIVQIRDATTGLLIRDVPLSYISAPRGLAVIPDLDHSGRAGLAVLGLDKKTGVSTVEIRDSATGGLVRRIICQ